MLWACMVWLSALSARANGRLPGATELTVNRSDPRHLVARATFGMVQSFDGGESWQWICERAVNVSGEADPPVAVTADDTIVLLPPASGALVSRDRGCTWSPAVAPLLDRRAVDLTVDPSEPARVLVIASAVDSIDARGVVAYANALLETRDNAQTWSELSQLPASFFAETVEIATSDPNRIYVGGTSSADPTLGIVQRSEDGGRTWRESGVQLPPGSGSMFISAVDPRDPDRLWVRLPARGDRFGILPVSLIVSSDKGESWATLTATEHQAMLGFALSPDGTRLAYGGPGDGLYVGASDGSQGFSKVSDLRVRCLRWYRDGLYACGTESVDPLQPGDPFSAGISSDEGKSFRAIYTMANTCPQRCADASDFESTCRDVWTVLAPSFAASGDGCAVSWSQTSEPDAGTSPVTSADAGTVNASARIARAGCSAAVGGAPNSSICALLLLACFWRFGRRALLAAVGVNCGTAETATAPDAAGYVACPETIPELAAGATFSGQEGRVQVELSAASHMPARKYRNEWVLGLLDAHGQAIDDAVVARIEAFMPVHGHYSRPSAEIAQREHPAELDATVYFTMRGPWEVQMEVRSATAGDDYVVINVCVEE